jgi:hypothetical protein
MKLIVFIPFITFISSHFSFLGQSWNLVRQSGILQRLPMPTSLNASSRNFIPSVSVLSSFMLPILKLFPCTNSAYNLYIKEGIISKLCFLLCRFIVALNSYPLFKNVSLLVPTRNVRDFSNFDVCSCALLLVSY